MSGLQRPVDRALARGALREIRLSVQQMLAASGDCPAVSLPYHPPVSEPVRSSIVPSGPVRPESTQTGAVAQHLPWQGSGTRGLRSPYVFLSVVGLVTMTVAVAAGAASFRRAGRPNLGWETAA